MISVHEDASPAQAGKEIVFLMQQWRSLTLSGSNRCNEMLLVEMSIKENMEDRQICQNTMMHKVAVK